MDTLSYKTISANKATVTKNWVLIDANDQMLGRLSSKVANLLRGKHKTNYTPHVDCGDNVIIINAEKIKLSGDKNLQKKHFTYSGYPGGFRMTSPTEMLKKKPTAVIEIAVKGMLPKNRLGSVLFGNLHVYVGTTHPHEAQQPQVINLNEIK